MGIFKIKHIFSHPNPPRLIMQRSRKLIFLKFDEKIDMRAANITSLTPCTVKRKINHWEICVLPNELNDMIDECNFRNF